MSNQPNGRGRGRGRGSNNEPKQMRKCNILWNHNQKHFFIFNHINLEPTESYESKRNPVEDVSKNVAKMQVFDEAQEKEKIDKPVTSFLRKEEVSSNNPPSLSGKYLYYLMIKIKLTSQVGSK